MTGVQIAVKDSKLTKKSQIYNYGIKKEATSTFNGLHGSETPTISDKPNVASNIIIPQNNEKINIPELINVVYKRKDGSFGLIEPE